MGCGGGRRGQVRGSAHESDATCVQVLPNDMRSDPGGNRVGGATATSTAAAAAATDFCSYFRNAAVEIFNSSLSKKKEIIKLTGGNLNFMPTSQAAFHAFLLSFTNPLSLSVAGTYPRPRQRQLLIRPS